MTGDDTEYSLALAFDTDDPEFCRGFEAGVLWQRLDQETGIEATIHATNAEMVMRMAEARGVPFAAEELDDEWVHVRLGTAAGVTQ